MFRRERRQHGSLLSCMGTIHNGYKSGHSVIYIYRKYKLLLCYTWGFIKKWCLLWTSQGKGKHK